MVSLHPNKTIQVTITPRVQKNYLLITALVIGSFGPVFSLGAWESTSLPAQFTLDLLNFPLDKVQHFHEPTTRFLSALTGGFLLGWGITIAGLRQWVFDFNPEGVRKTVVAGIMAWCIADSTGSVLAGANSNVFFNLLVLVLTIGPLYKKASLTPNS